MGHLWAPAGSRPPETCLGPRGAHSRPLAAEARGSGGGVAATRRRTILTPRTTRASLGTHRAQRARGPGQRVRPGLWRPAVRATAGSMLERPYVTPPVGAAASEGRHAASASSFGAQSPAGGQRALGAPPLRASSASGAHSPGRHVEPRGDSPQRSSRRGPPGGGQSAGAAGHRSRERSGPLGTGSRPRWGRHFRATPR